jgi:hypothetical protein
MSGEEKRKGKYVDNSIRKYADEEFAANFERDFSLVSCLSIRIATRSVLYLDNGASYHMT